MERPSWAPLDIDLNRPSAARVYDYYLGGSHNFAVDRRMAQEAMLMWPELPQIMQTNRAFLRRAVRYVVQEGIRQFIDIGSGIPTAGNVHEVAQRAASDARVVYVDIDPVAVAHSRAILAKDPQTTVVQADLREPEGIVDDPATRDLLDLDQPVAVLLVAVLHFIPDEGDPAAVVARLYDAVAPGSFLVISHASYEGQPDQASTHQQLYRRTATPMTMRSRSEIARLFDRFRLMEPGLVYLPLWRPDPGDDVDRPERTTGFAGVGRKDD
jgi:SAM-dependent methyltransferase